MDHRPPREMETDGRMDGGREEKKEGEANRQERQADIKTRDRQSYDEVVKSPCRKSKTT